MNTELYWLSMSLLITSLIWVPIIINRLIEHGFWRGLWDPDGATHTSMAWSKRLTAAHINAIENIVVFAPLVLMINQLQLNSPVTQSASILFFYSRFAHVILFTFRVPILRIVAFLSGFSAQIMLIAVLLGWL